LFVRKPGMLMPGSGIRRVAVFSLYKQIIKNSDAVK